MRIPIALAALMAAAAPLHAQGTHRFDVPGFTIELPQGVAELKLVRQAEHPTQGFQMFAGGGPSREAVIVFRTWPRAMPKNVDVRALQQAQGGARVIAEAEADTSAAGRRAFQQMVNDTALASRREFLEISRTAFARGNGWIALDSATREIVTGDRVTLRSQVKLEVGGGDPPLFGTADVSTPRNGLPGMWLVVYAAPQRTPELDALAARMLDSFRPTGAPAQPAAGGSPR